jgi:nucleotide-binding universal stress UspA family protein
MSRIVVGVDGSPHADRALRWAVREAELRAASIELVHGYVIHPHAAMFGSSDRELAEVLMDTVVERNRSVLDRTTWSATLVPLLTGPTSALLDAGEDADLIVAGSRGLGGFAELVLGATSYRTAAHASAPVAVIRGGDETAERDGDRDIVVGVDESRAGRRALRWALDEAGRRGVGVTVAHGYFEPMEPGVVSVASREQIERYRQLAHDEAAQLVDDVLNAVDVKPEITIERVVRAGTPAAVLLDLAADDRLLVVGTRGRGALGRAVFGSVSHQCLHHASGPMVVVP